MEDLLGRAHLLDARLVHHHHAVGHFEGFFLVVRHQQAGHVHLVVQPPQPAPQTLPHLGVERAEGFVEQQHRGFDGQRASQRHPLPLAAGKLRGVAVRPGFPVGSSRATRATRSRDGRFRWTLAARPHAQAEGDILGATVMLRNSA